MLLGLRSLWEQQTGQTFLKSLDGTLTFTGALNTIAAHLVGLASTLTFNGNLKKQVNFHLSGILTMSGVLVNRALSKLLAGTLTFTGALNAITAHLVMLSSTLTFNGALTKSLSKTLTGLLTFNGALTASKAALKALSGVLTFNGALTPSRLFFKALAGTLTFAGTLTSTLADILAKILGVMFNAGFYQRILGQLIFWEIHQGVDTPRRNDIQNIHDVDDILTKDDKRRIKEMGL